MQNSNRILMLLKLRVGAYMKKIYKRIAEVYSYENEVQVFGVHESANLLNLFFEEEVCTLWLCTDIDLIPVHI